jgi:hypothetical protein
MAKQREHVRSIRGKRVLVNPGHNPAREPAAVSGVVGSVVDVADETHHTVSEPKPVGGLRKEYYTLVNQLFRKTRFPQRDGTVIAVGVITAPVRLAPRRRYGGPQARVDYLDCSNVNLTGSEFSVEFLWGMKFQGADLSDAVFAHHELIDADGRLTEKTDLFSLTGIISNGNFEGADLSDAVFHHIRFSGETSMRSADLTGVDFANVRVNGTLDLRGATMDLAQYRTLRERRGSDAILLFDAYPLSELDGIDSEYLSVLLWTGEVAALHPDGTPLDNPSDFDPDLHLIPSWELHRLTDEETPDEGR